MKKIGSKWPITFLDTNFKSSLPAFLQFDLTFFMIIESFDSFKASWNCLKFVFEDDDYPKNQQTASKNKSRSLDKNLLWFLDDTTVFVLSAAHF